MTKPKRIRIQCLLCGDIIESRFTHDFVVCSCGEIFVDGGTDYLRMGAKRTLHNIIQLTDDAKLEGGESVKDSPKEEANG